MSGFVVDQEQSASDIQLAYWKPGMQRHAVVKKNVDDGNFPGWMQSEVMLAPKGLIFFFVTTSTDIF
jgi:hypothetical protein